VARPHKYPFLNKEVQLGDSLKISNNPSKPSDVSITPSFQFGVGVTNLTGIVGSSTGGTETSVRMGPRFEMPFLGLKMSITPDLFANSFRFTSPLFLDSNPTTLNSFGVGYEWGLSFNKNFSIHYGGGFGTSNYGSPHHLSSNPIDKNSVGSRSARFYEGRIGHCFFNDLVCGVLNVVETTTTQKVTAFEGFRYDAAENVTGWGLMVYVDPFRVEKL
jgi:hypothetical protein